MAKTCESVITNLGFLPKLANVSLSSYSFTTIAVASASNISLIVCCCGSINLPFGAALSIGTTRTTKSEGSNKSPTIWNLASSVGACFAISSFNSYIFSFVTELTHRVLGESSNGNSIPFSLTKSSLFITTIYGIFFSLNFSIKALSCGVGPTNPSITNIPISVLFKT